MVSHAHTLKDVVHLNCRPGKTTILGITGYAGAGKHSVIAPMTAHYAKEIGFDVHVLDLDSFFIHSRADRKQWLEDAEGTPEYETRSDLMTWWGFYEARAALNTLRSGKALKLDGVYDRSNDGELTRVIDIKPASEGSLIIFEGVAIVHLLDAKDTLVFVHAPPEVRRQRLLRRDQYRAGAEAEERFRITEDFDHNYFNSNPNYPGRPLYFIDNSHDGEHDFKVEYLNQLGMQPAARKKYYCKTVASEA